MIREFLTNDWKNEASELLCRIIIAGALTFDLLGGPSVALAGLDAERQAEFHARPEIADLLNYSKDDLDRAGRAILEHTGRLLLTPWAVECSWPGLGLVDLSWQVLRSADEDTLIHARELPAAAISGVSNSRRRDVLARRLGLHDYQPQSLETVGAALEVSKERARQLQEKALQRLRAPVGHPAQFS